MNNGHLTNQAAVREFALAVAERNHPAKGFTRVSQELLDRMEAKLRIIIAAELHAMPSIGVTIK